MGINRDSKRIIGFLIIVIIFYFLCKTLFSNAGRIKEYEFSFNYYYLLISIVVLILNIFYRGIIWNKILRIFEPDNKLGILETIKINTSANFGKYMPGKMWSIVGAVYLGNKAGISKKSLAVSYTLQTMIGILSGFFIGAIFLFLALQDINTFFNYLILLIILPIIIIIARPDWLLRFINFILSKFKKDQIERGLFPNTRQLIGVFLHLITSRLINGIAFYLFVFSLVPLVFSSIFGIIGIFIIANTTGFTAIFAPGGIGVREGILALLLQYYLPIAIATLIAVLARIWMVIADIMAFVLIRIFR